MSAADDPVRTVAPSAADLTMRTFTSVAACSLIAWQMTESAKNRRGSIRSTLLESYLLMLMALSVLEGVVGVAMDLMLLEPDGSLAASNVAEEIGLSIVLGEISEAIISLLIIGLGVHAVSLRLRHARVATALGVMSLISRALPAPLVLVAGVMCLQRTSRPPSDTAANAQKRSCCSLRCALRPLLCLALLEMWYADMPLLAGKEFEARMQRAKRETGQLLDAAHVSNADEVRLILNVTRPEQILELGEKALGEVVQLGVVVALGLSGRARGLRLTWMPIVAAFVPGLPNAFAIVFYFLLDTRQSGSGGSLLPVSRPLRAAPR